MANEIPFAVSELAAEAICRAQERKAENLRAIGWFDDPLRCELEHAGKLREIRDEMNHAISTARANAARQLATKG